MGDVPFYEKGVFDGILLSLCEAATHDIEVSDTEYVAFVLLRFLLQEKLTTVVEMFHQDKKEFKRAFDVCAGWIDEGAFAELPLPSSVDNLLAHIRSAFAEGAQK